jgi:hypothetical protein
VKCLRGYFRITTKQEPTPELAKRRLQGWYRNRAEVVFRERLDARHARVEREGIPRPALKIKYMHKRWGSCAPDGTITLNLELIRASKECIDYVIMHELCHIKEAHHGPRFSAPVRAGYAGLRRAQEATQCGHCPVRMPKDRLRWAHVLSHRLCKPARCVTTSDDRQTGRATAIPQFSTEA